MDRTRDSVVVQVRTERLRTIVHRSVRTYRYLSWEITNDFGYEAHSFVFSPYAQLRKWHQDFDPCDAGGR